MSRRKRYPSTQLHISQIYTGEVKELRDIKYFEIDGQDIPRVNIFGVVIDKYDGLTQNGRKFASITIDDGSSTIKVKVWSRPTENDEGNVIRDPYLLLKDIKNGDIVDVVGRVREYNEEFFIDPTIVNATDDLEWEINRRIQMVQKYMDTAELEDDETIPFNQQEEMSELMPNVGVSDIELKNSLIQAFDNDFEKNTIEELASRSKIAEDVVISLIDTMKESGEIYMPRPDRYDLIPV